MPLFMVFTEARGILAKSSAVRVRDGLYGPGDLEGRTGGASCADSSAAANSPVSNQRLVYMTTSIVASIDS